MDSTVGIVDRSGDRHLAIGVESFEDVLEAGVYVDKTLLVKELLDRRKFGATLFCRPRRFGKSLAMRMLQCYFEVPVDNARTPVPDRSALFEGMAISKCGERYTREMGAHPVVYLSLNGVDGSSWDKAAAELAKRVAAEVSRHGYLLEGDGLDDDEKAALLRLRGRSGDEADLAGSLSLLSRVLHRRHGSKCVILIDEYDHPVTAGHLRGYRTQAVDFMRTWLTESLKSTTDLFLGVLTGVQRVSRESIFSGLNNVEVDTALDARFAEAFGFTAAEAEALASYVGLADKVPEMRNWYDGYCFGGTDVYNPWSVLGYLGDGATAQPYWSNTSGNDIVRTLFSEADERTRERLASLADGGSIREPLRLDTVFDEVGRDPRAVWSQLYLAGYLTTDDVELPRDPDLPRELRIPNHEVARLYRREFIERAHTLAGNDSERLEALHAALVHGDAPAFAGQMSRVLDKTASYHDLSSENSYHMLVTGLLAGVPGYKLPHSNRESGDGRPDVTLEPTPAHEHELPALVIEIKRARTGDADGDALQALAESALAQARSRRYVAGLSGCGARLWGVAFGGKRCAAACGLPDVLADQGELDGGYGELDGGGR